MTTLFDATLALAKVLGNVRSSTTTAAGSATTIIDSTRTEPADYWDGGTLWITSGAKASTSRKITDWVLTTTTFTIPTTTTAAGSGAAYSVLDAAWPQDKLIEFINMALQEHCKVLASNATLPTVAYQESYTLPAGVANVKRVEIAINSASPYQYAPHYGWREVGDGTIKFDTGTEPADSGYILRLWYESPHAVLSADADVVSAYINADRLTWEAAVYAWQWRIGMSGTDRPEYNNRMSLAMAMAQQMRGRYPTKFMPRDPRLTV